MTLQPTTLQETTETLRRGLDEIARLVGEIPGAVDDLLHRVELPAPVVEFIVRTATDAVELVASVLDRLHQLLVGAAAPVWFFEYAHRWGDVRGVTSGVTGALVPDLMPAAGTWTGDAASAYARAAGPQRDATERLGTLITKIDSALTACAIAGGAFYVALAAAATAMTFDLIASLFTMITGIGVPIGLVTLIGGTGTVVLMTITAVSTLVAVLTVQASQMTALHGEAADVGAFPGGHWPNPLTRTYADATVTDGDADWSLRH